MSSFFEEYLAGQQSRHGAKFSEVGLARKFIPYFNNRRRIEVRFSCGTVKRGTVGASMGWQPQFMLLLRRDSMGSPWLLSDRDEVLREIPKRS